jgi:uncharacterized protein YuzE
VPKFAFDYDAENDDLFIYRKDAKSKGSVEIDNLIIDFDSRGRITAIEFIDASRILFKQLKITRSRLNQIIECKVEIMVKGNMLVILLLFVLSRTETLSHQLIVPNIVKASPALN